MEGEAHGSINLLVAMIALGYAVIIGLIRTNGETVRLAAVGAGMGVGSIIIAVYDITGVDSFLAVAAGSVAVKLCYDYLKMEGVFRRRGSDYGSNRIQ